MAHPCGTENTWVLLRITRNTRLWRKGQRVWLVNGTGALAGEAIGRYRGRGRWIRGWVHWADNDGRGFKGPPDARWIDEVMVSPAMYEQLQRLEKCMPY